MSLDHRRLVREHIEGILPGIERPAAADSPHPWLSATFSRRAAGPPRCWDELPMAMRLACAGRPEFLRHMVDSRLCRQTETGFVPECAPGDARPPVHAQPFLAQAAFLYLSASEDRAWAAEVFPAIQRYLACYEANGAAAGGLFYWPAADMSPMGNDPAIAFFPPGTVASCDINAWLHLEFLAAAGLAAAAGDSAASERRRGQAAALREAVNARLWNEEEGTYAALNLVEGRACLGLRDTSLAAAGRYAFQSASNLVPLYARMASPEWASRMIETYLLSERHFWCPFGVRSLSRSSEYYNDAVWGNPAAHGPRDRLVNSNWQGPVWMALNYLAFHALLHYGYRAEADRLDEITQRTLAHSLIRMGSFAENFHAETGDPLHGDCVASWNVLADVMGQEFEGRWVLAALFE